jgi:hypothetical protein
VSEWLRDQLAAGLPKHEAPIFGSPQEWDILLTYEDRRRQGDEHMPVLRYTFDTLFLRLPAARRLADKPTERTLEAAVRHLVAKKALAEGESTRWHSWLDDFAHIHSPQSGAGLVQLVFPRLEAALALPPKRRRLKR